jgi:acetyl esterase/lipase
VLVGSEWREETLAFNEQVRALMAQLPGVETVPPEVTRRARYDGTGALPKPVFLPQARWEEWDDVRVRILAPTAEPRGTFLHIHGGGWTLGAADHHDPLLWEFAEASGLAVASVEYRLAPEHPHPAGLEDCLTAARHLPSSGLPGPYAIGGESAGAHLAVLTMLRVPGFAAANLSYGAYDLSGTPSRRLYDDTLVLTDHGMEWFTENLLPGLDGEARRAPEISPLYADLAGVPPALFTVGTCDPLLDDSLFMAARWPGEHELRVYDSACHGFNVFPVEIARDANAAMAGFVSRALAAAA